MTPGFTTRSILFLVAVTMAAAPAVAQGYGPGGGMGMGNPDAPWRQRFAAIDTNSDGLISKIEMRENAEGVFAAMDTNGDGALTVEEYMSVRMGPQLGRNPARMEMRQKDKAARFPAMDENRDGKVDRAEFLRGAEMRFTSADRNRDGTVTPLEFRARAW